MGSVRHPIAYENNTIMNKKRFKTTLSVHNTMGDLALTNKFIPSYCAASKIKIFRFSSAQGIFSRDFHKEAYY